MRARHWTQWVLIGVVAVLVVAGSVLIWSDRTHYLGQALLGAAVVLGVVVPAIGRAREQRRGQVTPRRHEQ